MILNDLDEAIAGLPETYPAGRANANAARALKSEVCLTAAAYSTDAARKKKLWEQAVVAVDAIRGYSLDANYGGMHYWDDYVYIEIIDPKTGKTLPDGEEGEIVITTLVKEGAPLIRFRTHDISRIIPGECPCGRKHPRLDIIKGRSDDMFKVHGVNMFPSQVEELLALVDGVPSEYTINIAHDEPANKDIMLVTVEAEGRVDFEQTGRQIRDLFKSRIGVTPKITVVPVGTLPRSEKKTQRVIDHREQ